MEAVLRQGHKGFLTTAASGRAVKVHPNLLSRLVHMHVRRSNVPVAAWGFRQLERAWLVDGPRPFELIGIGEPDVIAAVVGEIEVVVPQPIADPRGDAHKRRTVDIVARIAWQHFPADDGILREPLNVDRIHATGHNRRHRYPKKGGDSQECPIYAQGFTWPPLTWLVDGLGWNPSDNPGGVGQSNFCFASSGTSSLVVPTSLISTVVLR